MPVPRGARIHSPERGSGQDPSGASRFTDEGLESPVDDLAVWQPERDRAVEHPGHRRRRDLVGRRADPLPSGQWTDRLPLPSSTRPPITSGNNQWAVNLELTRSGGHLILV